MASGFAKPIRPKSALADIPKREWNLAYPEHTGDTPEVNPRKELNWWAPDRFGKPVPGPNPLRRVWPRKEPPDWKEAKAIIFQDSKHVAKDVKAKFGWGVSAPSEKPNGGGRAKAKVVQDAKHRTAAAPTKGTAARGAAKAKVAPKRAAAAAPAKQRAGAAASTRPTRKKAMASVAGTAAHAGASAMADAAPSSENAEGRVDPWRPSPSDADDEASEIGISPEVASSDASGVAYAGSPPPLQPTGGDGSSASEGHRSRDAPAGLAADFGLDA